MKREDVKRVLTKHKLDFGLIMDRLKRALGINSDAALAARLGMSASNYANRKAMDSIPYDLVLPLCITEGISLNWVFSGAGETFTKQDDPRGQHEAGALIDPLLFATILVSLDAAKRAHAPHKSTVSPQEQLAQLALSSAGIYNTVSRHRSGKARLSAALDEVEEIGRLTAIVEEKVQAIKGRMLRDAE